MKPLLIVTCCIASAALILGIVLVTHVMWPAPTAAVVTTAPVPSAEAKPSAAVQPAAPLPVAVPDPPKNPAIMLMVETPKENHAWVNYWDNDGMQRGVHIICPVAQAADQSERDRKFWSDLLAVGAYPHNPFGWAKLGSDVLQPAEPQKPGACQILKRTWHYQYGGNGRLEMVEGSNNLGPVKMPN